jgi:hypothetical protein
LACANTACDGTWLARYQAGAISTPGYACFKERHSLDPAVPPPTTAPDPPKLRSRHRFRSLSRARARARCSTSKMYSVASWAEPSGLARPAPRPPSTPTNDAPVQYFHCAKPGEHNCAQRAAGGHCTAVPRHSRYAGNPAPRPSALRKDCARARAATVAPTNSSPIVASCKVAPAKTWKYRPANPGAQAERAEACWS